jgi:hypothetical protein
MLQHKDDNGFVVPEALEVPAVVQAAASGAASAQSAALNAATKRSGHCVHRGVCVS